jgi:hypothetical protein
MRRRPAEEEEEIPGGDSFLDVIANMVGILVLLVVCVGVRAARPVTEAVATVDTAEVESLEAEAKAAARDAMDERRRVAKLAEQAMLSQAEAASRDEARVDMTAFVTKLRQELDAERAKLSEQDRRSFDTSNELAQVRLRLDELTRQQVALAAADTDAEVKHIEFDSTPIVRERVTDEVFVRLEGDRVAYVPLDELKQALELVFDSIAQGPGGDVSKVARYERVVGPIEGFSLRCLFERGIIRSPRGTVLATQLVLARLEDQGNVVTETIDEATTTGSSVARRLDALNAKKTVVTVVAYPDSFDTLPDLEKRLRDRGVRVAKTLQRSGQSITFSPGGRTTTLQ